MPVVTNAALYVCVLRCRPIVPARPFLTDFAFQSIQKASVAVLLLSALTSGHLFLRPRYVDRLTDISSKQRAGSHEPTKYYNMSVTNWLLK